MKKILIPIILTTLMIFSCTGGNSEINIAGTWKAPDGTILELSEGKATAVLNSVKTSGNIYPADISAVKAGDIFDYRVQESDNTLLISENYRLRFKIESVSKSSLVILLRDGSDYGNSLTYKR